jgi:Tol biopolymer transport system component
VFARFALALMMCAGLFGSLGGPTPARAQQPSDWLSYVGDVLPQRQRDLYIMRLDGSDKKQLTQGFNVWFASWSPDGKQIALSTEAGELYLVNPETADRKLLTQGAFSPPFWSPDGHFIAYVGGEKFGTPVARGNLRIISAGGGQPWAVPGGEDIPSLPPGASAVAWSPDGTRIAAGWPGRILHVAGGPGSTVGVEALPGPKRDWFVVAGGWAPNGRYLAVTDGTDYGVLDLTNGNFNRVAGSLPQPGMARAGVAWAAPTGKMAYMINSARGDGQRLFMANMDGSDSYVILAQPYLGQLRGEVTDYGPPFFSSDFKTMLVRVSRTTREANGDLLYTHESWLVRADGTGGEKLLDGFNANWRPKPRLDLPDPGFWYQWRTSDLPVANGQTQRSWLWGPTAIYSGTEAYAEAPGGQQQVVYFDKGRMDLPNPNPPQPTRFLVVPGALARDMVMGQIATGATATEARQSPDIVLAGDNPDADVPTYATFHTLGAGTDAGKAQDRTGQPVEQVLARDGTVRTDTGLGALAKIEAFVPETAHNIPDVFMAYFKSQPWDWIYVAGYPISEPYWAHVEIGGQARSVLVQVFERRTITFDPGAPDGYKVQFGNVGRHYYDWRYSVPAPGPVPAPTGLAQ